MSFDAMEWAWQPSSLNPHERLTLVNLAWRLNQTSGKCFPSLSRIALDTGISRRGVQNSLKSLETKGLIQRVPRFLSAGIKGRNSNGYILPAMTKIISPYLKHTGVAMAASGMASVAAASEADSLGGEGSAHEQGSNAGMEQGSNACAAADSKAKGEEKQSEKHKGKLGGAIVAIPTYVIPVPIDPPLSYEEVLAQIASYEQKKKASSN